MVAVKVTEAPAHIGPVGACAILMVGVTTGSTLRAMVLLVAVAEERQFALLVMVQTTCCKSPSVLVVYVLPVPWLTPPTVQL